jgi:Rod binding domain-containing protein
MFEGVSTDGPFGGGQGEGAFRSFLMDAFAQQISKSGGIGVGAAVQREMLKMQGLS